MKKAVILCLSVLICLPAFSQNYSLIEVNNFSSQLRKLMSIGIALDHASIDQNQLQIAASEYEVELLEKAQIEYRIVIQDAERNYERKKNLYSRDGQQALCVSDKKFEVRTPENFQFGPMKGHLTYDQILEELDFMHQQYPGLIGQKEAIGDFTTYEGRPIYMTKIGKGEGNNRPEILYTSLHHSREPMSMTQLIYYMWYVLENYDNHPLVQQLVDHVDMYFVPVVNPDGYIYNSINHPDGGGLWRKNRRLNADGTFGVDLNRNYGFKWGFDDFGSSPNPGSEVYRGTSAFSEPETQAIRFLCTNRKFKIALNYHSYGNFLIYPFGYTDESFAEYESFDQLAEVLTNQNHYVYGTGVETVAYLTNGDSDDWMYGDMDEKDPICAYSGGGIKK